MSEVIVTMPIREYEDLKKYYDMFKGFESHELSALSQMEFSKVYRIDSEPLDADIWSQKHGFDVTIRAKDKLVSTTQLRMEDWV